ncbi:MAG: gluconolactonase [Phenylobacterium sp.]|jgi:gluconolactonase
MSNNNPNPNPIPLIAVVCAGFLATSCSTMTTTNQTNDLVSISNANASYCPAGSEAVKLDLTTVSLTRALNIPLMYQGYNNIEGPVWHDGALYYSNMGSHQPDENGFALSNQTTIWRWVVGEKPQIWLQDSVAGTNGLALDSKGNLLAGRQLDGSLSTIDWQTKQVTPMVTTYQNKRFNSPNDLTIGHDDTVYFTDPNWNTPSNIQADTVQGGGQSGSIEPGQRIYRVTADGKVNATDVTEMVPALRDKPNGIILSLDQQQLIIGGLQGLWAFDLHAGAVSNPQRLLTTPIDGLGKDCSGNIYVTTTRELATRTDGQVVVVLDKNHQEVGELIVEGIHIVTNIAFGGADGKTLFVTGLTAPMDGDKLRQCGDAPCLTAGIYTTKLNVQGFPY